MKTNRYFLGKIRDLMESAKHERDSVAKEGRSSAWNHERYKEIESKYRASVTENIQHMLEASQAEIAEAEKQARLLRNRPPSPLKPIDGNEKVYHQNRVSQFLFGLNEEQSIEECERILANLADHEAPFRHIYEDGLLSKIKDPVHRLKAEETIYRYKPIKERVAIAKADEAKRIHGKLENLKNIMIDDVVKVATGKMDIPTYDFVSLIDEPEYTNEPQVEKVAINPID